MMGVTTKLQRCSFCNRSRLEVKAMVEGKNGVICDRCATWAASKRACIAACHLCEPVNGAHAVGCPERLVT